MAHRGRLNVLANIIGKSPREIFREFADLDPELHLGRGDVKYHLGYSQRLDHRHGQQGPPVALLQPEPSGVRQPASRSAACGPSRTATATSQRRTGHGRSLIHGDAAFAGEGVVQETLNLSELPGYSRRRHAARHRQQPDRLHHDADRSPLAAPTATDVAKMLQIPIFHVNGEDPEAVAQVRAAGAGLPPASSSATS